MQIDQRLETGRVLLGERLRDVRLDRGLTLQQTYEKCGVSVGQNSDLERGVKTPTLQVLLRLADAYGTTADELLRGVYPFGSRRPPRRRG